MFQHFVTGVSGGRSHGDGGVHAMPLAQLATCVLSACHQGDRAIGLVRGRKYQRADNAATTSLGVDEVPLCDL